MQSRGAAPHTPVFGWLGRLPPQNQPKKLLGAAKPPRTPPLEADFASAVGVSLRATLNIADSPIADNGSFISSGAPSEASGADTTSRNAAYRRGEPRGYAVRSLPLRADEATQVDLV
jgi:hypothetical protein